MRNKGNNSSDSNNGEKPKKERHIVSWSQEEDDILREQIRLHGTENWTVIASKFKDKTTRQCRRRWFTYLNSDFKKGGWSPEEDMLLCEAQRVFGNRWTEIAKVVSGRTDNAVKNRFTTLCKKRAKQEALAKENSDISYINLYNKRAIFSNGINVDGGSETVAPFKKIRTCMISNQEERISEDSGVVDHTLRHPFSVLAHNVHRSDANFPDQLLVCKEATAVNKSEGTFLKKDDPRVIALMQQAELLNSLATKVSSEKTDQSLESAWTVLEDHLKQKKESGLVENLSSCHEGSLPLWRESDMYESSPSSSEYSTGSTVLPNVPCNKAEGSQTQICVIKQNSLPDLKPNQLNIQQSLAQETGICIGHDTSTNKENNELICEDLKENKGAVCDYPNAEFNSPLHVTPLFRALAAAIPSPKFSESEKHFLMKTLGMESPSSTPRTDPSRPPLCKRSLLHCL